MLIPAINKWWTDSEWGVDGRSGAVALSKERSRRPSDRPGKFETVWDWSVHVDREVVASGTSQNQVAARAAVRKFVRTLPDK